MNNTQLYVKSRENYYFLLVKYIDYMVSKLVRGPVTQRKPINHNQNFGAFFLTNFVNQEIFLLINMIENNSLNLKHGHS